MLCLSVFIFSTAPSSWALQLQEGPTLHAFKTTESIVLDGALDEEIWKNTKPISDFWQYFPADTTLATAQTEVWLTYDKDFIYIAAKMHHPGSDDYVSTSLRRDYRGEQNDGFTIIFDTFSDNTNAYQFGVNPYGVQREGLVANGGINSRDLDLAWDNIWYAEARIYDEYWIAEVAIPFKTLRFKEGGDRWNANFYRLDSHFTERSTWAPIPRNYPLIAMAFMGKILWEEPLGKPGSNLALIPFTAGSYTNNYLEGTGPNTNLSFGGDAKLAVGPALNLDLTFNPDFSQVEVDQQVTNLDRFEIFFPERRQFFLENADLFASFGTERIRPFFSRRIGVDRDENTGQNIQNRIIYGARLSGKLDNNWRVGFLNMQTDRVPASGIEGQNFTVAAVQRKVFARSNVGMVFINKEAFEFNKPVTGIRPDGHNRLLGLDYNLASADNKWSGKAFYHRSFDATDSEQPFAASARIAYDDLHWTASLFYNKVGEGFNPEVGFTPRRDYNHVGPRIGYTWFPQSNIINRHGPTIDFDFIWNETFGLTDQNHSLSYNIGFQSLANLNVAANFNYIYLFFPFDPTNTRGERLAADTDYSYWNYRVSYRSDFRKPFSFNVNASTGDYFNGTRDNVSTTLNYRMGYKGTIALSTNYNRIRLPEPYNDADLLLIGPRFDFTFSRSVFWTLFVQYNNQIDNVNINSRLQWRFRPVSDFFLVYTDNYLPDVWSSKNRAIVAKFTYWLNL